MVKLYRSIYDRKITGLCGGLAQMLGMDPTIIRVLVVILAVFSAGTAIWIYLIASLVVPKEPYPHDPYRYEAGNQGHTKWHGSSSFDHRYGRRHSCHTHHGSNPNVNSTVPSKLTEESSPIDAMMESIEKKALKKELEELRAKVAKYEKGDM